MKIYRGRRVGKDKSTTGLAVFEVEHRESGAKWALEHHVAHSPTGMNWGYAGSGPADLARSLCHDVAGKPVHTAIYQRVKFDLVARLHQEHPFEIAEDTIAKAIEQARLAAGVTCVSCADTGFLSGGETPCDCPEGQRVKFELELARQQDEDPDAIPPFV